MSGAQVGAFRVGEIVVARLPTGDAYARVVDYGPHRRGILVDLCGARIVVASVMTAPKAVQP